MRTGKPGNFKLRTLVVAALVAVAAGVLAPGSATAAKCPGSHSTPENASVDKLRGATLCLLNRERRGRGLRALDHNAELGTAAVRHTRDMVRRRYFSHDSPDGSDMVDRIRRAGYLRSARTWGTGENIAWGGGYYATPASIVRGWMRSAGHRHNILNGRFDDIGIGIVQGLPVRGFGNQGGTFTTDFGFRR